MTGFMPLFRIELRTMRRTWHRHLMPALLAFFALLAVLTSRFAPEIVSALAGDGYTLRLPEPSWDQAYAQWAKNLSQLGTFAVVLTASGATAGLISSGRAQLLAVRPVSRAAQPLAAFLARAVVLCAASAFGSLLVWAGTRIAYGRAPLGRLVSVSSGWMLLALVLAAVTVGLSALTGSTLGASGGGIGIYFLLSILSLADPIAATSPAGLVALPTALASGGQAELALPLATGILLAALVLSAGALSFSRREL